MTTASLWKSARIEVLTPSTLVLENNSRTILDIKAERAELIDSIREVGVLVPPIFNETPDGSYVVRDGFSRTLAAQVVVAEPEGEGEGELEMPVIVTTSQDEAVWQRLRDQFVINEIREGYNSADKARILEQFTLFGFDEEQIARHLSLDGEQVKAGLAVQRSTRAKTLMTENPQLDLFQLAVAGQEVVDAGAWPGVRGTGLAAAG